MVALLSYICNGRAHSSYSWLMHYHKLALLLLSTTIYIRVHNKIMKALLKYKGNIIKANDSGKKRNEEDKAR